MSSAQHTPGTISLPWSTTWRLVFFSISSGLLFGVDIGSIGAALHGMKQDFHLSSRVEQVVVSGAKGGAIAGCFLGGALMSVYGRRGTVATAAVPFAVGPLFICFATSVWSVVCGRLILGLGVGIASVAAPCYLSEVAPPAVRGTLVSVYELAVALGFLIAGAGCLAIEATAPCTYGCWRYQAGVVPLCAVIPLIFAVLPVPESPRWLLSRAGSDQEQLRGVLVAMERLGREGASERLAFADMAASEGTETSMPFWRPSGDDLVALWDQQHLAMGSPLWLPPSSMARSCKEEGKVSPSVGCSTVAKALSSAVGDICAVGTCAAHVPEGASRALALSVLAAILNQACASTSVLVYAQDLLEETGVVSRKTQDILGILVAAAKLLGVALGLVIVERMNRRTLLGWGAVFCAVGLFLLSAGVAWTDTLLLICGACGFIFSFFCSWGLGFWVVVTELTAWCPRYGNAGQSAATAMMFGAGWATDLTFVSVMECGPWALSSYALVGALMAGFSFVILPETRGCTLEECADRVKARPAQASSLVLCSSPEEETDSSSESESTSEVEGPFEG